MSNKIPRNTLHVGDLAPPCCCLRGPLCLESLLLKLRAQTPEEPILVALEQVGQSDQDTGPRGLLPIMRRFEEIRTKSSNGLRITVDRAQHMEASPLDAEGQPAAAAE